MADSRLHTSAAAPAYTPTARVLHWVTAALVLIQIPLGVVIANVKMGSDTLYNLHKSIGAILIPIVLIRLVYRLTHKPAPLPSDIPPLQRLAAESMHWCLYGLLVLQGLIGWIATSAYPAPIPVFGLFEMPHIWWEDRGLSDRLFVVHRAIGIIMAFLLVGHIGAALQHHFVRRDRVLMRMVTG